MTFAVGRKAIALCERCGFECKYQDLREEYKRGLPQGNAICPRCYDPDHPQEWAGQDTLVDHEALYDPRPEDWDELRSFAGFNPVAGMRLMLRGGAVSVTI